MTFVFPLKDLKRKILTITVIIIYKINNNTINRLINRIFYSIVNKLILRRVITIVSNSLLDLKNPRNNNQNRNLDISRSRYD